MFGEPYDIRADLTQWLYDRRAESKQFAIDLDELLISGRDASLLPDDDRGQRSSGFLRARRSREGCCRAAPSQLMTLHDSPTYRDGVGARSCRFAGMPWIARR